MIHAQVLFSSLGRLIHKPSSFAMTVIVLALALTFATGFYLIVANMQQLTGTLEDSSHVSIFLKQHVTDDQGRRLAAQLEEQPNISQVVFISRQQALQEFKQYSGFGEALDALDSNPLPNVIQVLPENTLTDDNLIQELIVKLEQLPEVDFVQMDMAWLKRLQALMRLANTGVLILAVIFALGILFITGNTIRLELQKSHEEIHIAQLVGATHGFIRRPFLYSGFWYGFFAGVIAWIMVSLVVFLIQQPLEELSELYDEQLAMRFLNFKETLMLLIISVSLGVAGAWLVLHGQIQQLRPEN